MVSLFDAVDPPDNQEGSDWRDEDEKLPGHENLTEKDIELFRHIQELALQVGLGKAAAWAARRRGRSGGAGPRGQEERSVVESVGGVWAGELMICERLYSNAESN